MIGKHELNILKDVEELPEETLYCLFCGKKAVLMNANQSDLFNCMECGNEFAMYSMQEYQHIKSLVKIAKASINHAKEILEAK